MADYYADCRKSPCGIQKGQSVWNSVHCYLRHSPKIMIEEIYLLLGKHLFHQVHFSITLIKVLVSIVTL